MAKPTPGNTSSGTGAGVSITFAHTVPAGSNRALYVTVNGWSSAATFSGVTYGGVALTKVADSGLSSARDTVQIWRLLNPTAGTANVVVSTTGGGTTAFGACARSYTDASQGTANTAATGTGSSASPSVTVTANATNDFVIDGLAWDATTATATMVTDSGRTSLFNNTAAGEGKGTSEDQAVASSEVMDWTLSVSATWAMAGIAVSGISGGTAFTQSLTGSGTGSGAVTKQGRKSPTGSGAGTGLTTRAAAKPIAGSGVGTGAATRRAAKPITGTGSGTGSATRSTLKSLVGAGAGTGAAVVKAVAKALALAGSGAGALTKLAAKSLIGTGTGTGTLSALRVKLLSLFGSGSGAGALTKQATKPITGAGAGSGATTRRASKALTGTGTGTGAIVKRVAKALATAGTGVGNLTRQFIAGGVAAASWFYRLLLGRPH